MELAHLARVLYTVAIDVEIPVARGAGEGTVAAVAVAVHVRVAAVLDQADVNAELHIWVREQDGGDCVLGAGLDPKRVDTVDAALDVGGCVDRDCPGQVERRVQGLLRRHLVPARDFVLKTRIVPPKNTKK